VVAWPVVVAARGRRCRSGPTAGLGEGRRAHEPRRTNGHDTGKYHHANALHRSGPRRERGIEQRLITGWTCAVIPPPRAGHGENTSRGAQTRRKASPRSPVEGTGWGAGTP